MKAEEIELEKELTEVERLNDMGSAAIGARDEAIKRMKLCANKIEDLQKPPPIARPGTPSLKKAREHSAYIWWLRGRISAALVSESISQQQSTNNLIEAENCLTKAVRLSPELTEAWILLGEIACKNGNLANAKLYMARAVDVSASVPEKRKIALRNLSMILRQIVSSSSTSCTMTTEMFGLVEEGLRFASEAVSLDVTDGNSWFVLGNALVSKSLSTGSGLDEIRNGALKAYDRAEQCGFHSPDLHFNRAAALTYIAENEKACEENWKAHEMDPGWDAPLKECQRICQVIEKINSLLVRKRAKSSIKVPQPSTTIENRTGELLFDIVGIATGSDEAPLTIVVDDGGGKFGGRYVLCLFGISQNAIHSSDVIAIANGFSVENMKFNWNKQQQQISLNCKFLRVSSKHIQTINGLPILPSAFAIPIATMTQ